MKHLLLALTVLLTLTACTTVPVTQEFPELPAELSTECKSLILIDGPEPTLSGLVDTVTKNYALHHECAAQVTGLLKWYKEQKKLFDEVNN